MKTNNLYFCFRVVSVPEFATLLLLEFGGLVLKKKSLNLWKDT